MQSSRRSPLAHGSPGRRATTAIAIGLFLAYVAASQLVVRWQSRQLRREHTRMLNVADQLELMKRALRQGGGAFEPAIDLRGREEPIFPELGLEAGLRPFEHGVALHFSDPLPAREPFLAKYRSERVLQRSFSLITTADGRFVDMDWTDRGRR